jgi:hypothetical protein
MPPVPYRSRSHKRWKTIADGATLAPRQNFSRGKKGLRHFAGGNPPRFFLAFSRKIRKNTQEILAQSLLAWGGMMEANSTSPNFTTPQSFLNVSYSQGQNLSPLSCLPAQFFTDATNSEAHWSGTRRLLFAVLQDAVACWFRYRNTRSSQGRQLFQEIRDWFLTKNRDSLYDFENICIHLNLDADYFRRGLMGQTMGQGPKNWETHLRPGRLTRRRT